jgi:hypothetical protein
MRARRKIEVHQLIQGEWCRVAWSGHHRAIFAMWNIAKGRDDRRMVFVRGGGDCVV